MAQGVSPIDDVQIMEFRHKLLCSIFRVGTGGDGLPFGSLVMPLFFGRRSSWKWASRSDVKVCQGIVGFSHYPVGSLSCFGLHSGTGP
ncbi:hypothetical protein U1Q18_042446 [Sarracenia purpurea var. burkii]